MIASTALTYIYLEGCSAFKCMSLNHSKPVWLDLSLLENSKASSKIHRALSKTVSVINRTLPANNIWDASQNQRIRQIGHRNMQSSESIIRVDRKNHSVLSGCHHTNHSPSPSLKGPRETLQLVQFINTCAHVPFFIKRESIPGQRKITKFASTRQGDCNWCCSCVVRWCAVYHSFASLGSSLIAIHKSSYVQQAFYEFSIAWQNIVRKEMAETGATQFEAQDVKPVHEVRLKIDLPPQSEKTDVEECVPSSRVSSKFGTEIEIYSFSRRRYRRRLTSSWASCFPILSAQIKQHL